MTPFPKSILTSPDTALAHIDPMRVSQSISAIEVINFLVGATMLVRFSNAKTVSLSMGLRTAIRSNYAVSVDYVYAYMHS